MAEFEKTEPPTPRRREDARQQGNVARSTDLSAAITLLSGMVLLYLMGLRLLGGLTRHLKAVLGSEHSSNLTRIDDLVAVASHSGELVIWTAAPFMLLMIVVALLTSVGQVGFLLTAKPLTPSLSKLSVLRGAKNLVNARAGVRLLMSLLKVGLIATVAIIAVIRDLPRIMQIAQFEAPAAFAAASELVFGLGLKLSALLIVIALLDFAFQKWQHTRDLKMSKQEVKEEMKRMDGDPLIRQRRTRVARQLALQRIAQAVPRADVVVTNPTHYAVALKYDAKTMHAPKVVAKGADYLATRIRMLATTHGVPIVERKPLAQALYRSVEVGQEVSPDQYAAVAEILAYVYRLANRKSA